jgi:hypothetical protein
MCCSCVFVFALLFVCYVLSSVFLYFTLNWTWFGVPKCHVFTFFVGLCVFPIDWVNITWIYMDVHNHIVIFTYIHTYCDYILYTCSHTIYRYRYTMIYMITFVYTYDISIYNIYIYLYIFNYLYLHAYICVWYICMYWLFFSLTVGCDDLRREAVATISRNWQVKCARALYAFVSCSGLLYPWRLGLGKEIIFFLFFVYVVSTLI